MSKSQIEKQVGAVEPHRVVFATSLYYNALDCGMALGSYLWGIVVMFTSYRNIYLYGMVLILLTGIQYIMLTQRNSRVQGENV